MKRAKVYTPAFRYPADGFRWAIWNAYRNLDLNSDWSADRQERRAIRIRIARKFRKELPAIRERLQDLGMPRIAAGGAR